MQSLAGQTIAVLGGNSGIGLAVVRGAHALGARVIAVGRDRARLASVADAIAGVETASLDIREETQLAAFFRDLGALDHLVVTAGALVGAAPLAALDFAKVRDALDTKLYGSLLAAKHAAPILRSGGSIGFTSGPVGRKIVANGLVKSIINTALEGAVRQLARELAPLRVYGVCPGAVDTPNWSLMDDAARQAMFGRLAQSLPVGFVASVEDIASAYLFAMRSRALTGSVIDLDGGTMVAA